MIHIGILGCGTVGFGVYQLLRSNREDIQKQIGDEIQISKILVRNIEKAVRRGIDRELLCTNPDEIIHNPDISIVVELVGGTKDAYTFVTEALRSGKHVVTANKDLIASHFQELMLLADQNGVSLSYEASVGGGIPLIDSIHRTLAANRIQKIYGILNGTTNYILTKMTRDGISYADALAQAQELGYAEANPASDVEGADAARKIAILSTIAFHSIVSYDDVQHKGITDVKQVDIRFAEQSGYTVKLLAIAEQNADSADVYVRPALVPLTHPLASVSDSFNAVFLRGDAVGDVMLYGRGAGSLPTASSVVGDIMSTIRGTKNESGNPFYASLPIRDIKETEHVYYVRMSVTDKPLVLAGVAGILGDHSVSLASLVQEQRDDGTAELMLLTHHAKEDDLQKAVSDLMKCEYVSEINTMICLQEGDID